MATVDHSWHSDPEFDKAVREFHDRYNNHGIIKPDMVNVFALVTRRTVRPRLFMFIRFQ